MKKRLLLITIIFLIFFIYPCEVSAQEEVYDLKVVEASEVEDNKGIAIQKIKGEILEGQYKGEIKEISIPMNSVFVRAVKVGDLIKVKSSYSQQDVFFQFYDFNRTNVYMWLFIPFFALLITVVGVRGLKTLVPSMLLILGLLINFIPDIFVNKNKLIVVSLIIAIISFTTAYISTKNRLTSFLVMLSVGLSSFCSFIIFNVFAHNAYITPFVGTISIIDEEVYREMMHILITAILFVPLGAVINASIQITKNLCDKFIKGNKMPLNKALREGLLLSQKVTAGELNNLIVTIVGLSLTSVFYLKATYETSSFWNDGWIALQVVSILTAGISIMLVAPITSVLLVVWFSIKLRLKGKAEQRTFRIGDSYSR